MFLKNSKFFHFYAVLGESEKRNFRKFLRSPILVSRRDLINAIEFFDRNWKDLNNEKKDSIHLHSHLFGQKPYNEATIRRILNLLVVALKKFWEEADRLYCVKEILEPKIQVEKKLALLKALAARRLDKEFQFEFKQATLLIEKLPREIQYHQSSAELLEVRISWLKRTQPLRPRPELNQAQRHWEHAYLLEMLRFEIAIRNQDKLSGKQPHYLKLDRVKAQFEGALSESEMAGLLVSLLELDENGTIDQWRAAKKRLAYLRSKLSRETLSYGYRTLLNFASRRINEGISQFQDEIWELYQEILPLEILEEDGHFPKAHFENLVTIAAFRDDFPFVKDLFANYADKLDKEAHPITMDFCHGILGIESKELNKAKRYFHQVLQNSKNPTYKIVSHANLMKIKFEEGNYFDLIFYDYDAFRMRVKRRSEKTGLAMNHYRDFNRYLHQLAKVMDEGGKLSTLKKLSEVIGESSPLLNKTWLLRHCNPKG